jgi:hypothetical protein
VPRWIWSSRVFGLLFIHMFSLLVHLLRWCVSRSCCIVCFPLSCAPLMSLSLVANVAVYCVPLSASLYLLVTVVLSMYIYSVRLCLSLWFHRERHHSAIKTQNAVTSGLVISYSELTHNCNLPEPHSELSVAHNQTEQIYILSAIVTNKYRLADNGTP